MVYIENNGKTCVFLVLCQQRETKTYLKDQTRTHRNTKGHIETTTDLM